MERNFVPLISGTRSVPRSSMKKGTRSRSVPQKKQNAFQERRSLERVPKALSSSEYAFKVARNYFFVTEKEMKKCDFACLRNDFAIHKKVAKLT